MTFFSILIFECLDFLENILKKSQKNYNYFIVWFFFESHYIPKKLKKPRRSQFLVSQNIKNSKNNKKTAILSRLL